MNGLLVPKKVSSHGWEADKLVGESQLSCSYENVTFNKDLIVKYSPNRKGAVVDESHRSMVSK